MGTVADVPETDRGVFLAEELGFGELEVLEEGLELAGLLVGEAFDHQGVEFGAG